MADPKFFNNAGPFTLKELCEVTEGSLADEKDESRKINNVSPLQTAGKDDISFLDNTKYIDTFKKSKAGACIIREKFMDKVPHGMAAIISENPYHTYATIASMFYPAEAPLESRIAKTAIINESAIIGGKCIIEGGAVVGENVNIGNNCHIHAGSIIGKGCRIGDNCVINAGANISYAEIGNNVIIHQGVCIGQDGFGFSTNSLGEHVKVPQLGRVVIEDDVEIGANSCVDRGSGPDTIIGKGTKIDNLVQIGHNVQIGTGCIIVSHVGISGSTRIGNHVVIAGQVGVAGHLQIGDRVIIAAQSGVIKNVPDGAKIGGSPAVPINEFHRQTIAVKKLVKERSKKA